MTGDRNRTPPRPRLIVRIGVTGHRPNRLDPDQIDRIEGQCRMVIAAIAGIAADIARKSDYAGQVAKLRVVSSLAEGGDRLVASIGRDFGADLQCPLPFAAEIYESDFLTPESRSEFRTLRETASAVFELDGRRDDGDAAYEAAGRMVLNQSDLILAIWDGAPASGRGGTAQIVDEAVTHGAVVIWVRTEGEGASCLLSRGVNDALVERPLGDLARSLSLWLAPPEGNDATTSTLSAGYFSESKPRLDMGQLFSLFRDLVERGYPRWRSFIFPDPEDSARTEWEADVGKFERTAPLARAADSANAVSMPEGAKNYILGPLCTYFAWADRLSDYYAGLHRTSVTANYLLAAAAVIFALLSLGAEHFGTASVGGWDLPKWGASVELALILAILAITRIGRRRRWHQRWLDYRQLSELLRQMRFLGPLASPLSQRQSTTRSTHDDDAWVDWLFHAIVRQMGLVNDRADSRYIAIFRSWLALEFEDQVDYHERNQRMSGQLDRRLHHAGTICFVITLIACFVHLVTFNHRFHEPLFGMSVGNQFFDLVALSSAAFPALGAAFYGIRNHGEFARIAERSSTMRSELQLLKDQIDSLSEAELTLASLQQIARRGSDVMMAETTDWRFVLRFRPMSLPT